ncbi:hypothetical protein ONS95_003338 [Cadophora gregata]|uniref:uncharacterized protein n=1 Tax=Cadophora gregata TaxID=51156 RepID=UPI0026DA84EF|nr:uncharacterized protein ONS95_003338 [Cadophora gregata]KAK0108534.1 hypothetical protein ONS95_003338 [Cadophora gregata]KAK0108870.1 hypothetical protein ONS96_002708 [Cadophora gregata f. sp. sojae]
MMAPQGLGQVVSWYICTFFAIAFLVARLVVKWLRFKAFSLDDWFMVLAGGCLLTDLIIPQHMWNLGMAALQKASRDEFVGIMQMIIPGSIAYVTSLWAIKVALVIFYKKIAARTRLQAVYNVILVVLGVTWAVIFFDIIFQCYPIERKWTTDPNMLSEGVRNQLLDNYPQFVYLPPSESPPANAFLVNIFLDVVIIALPMSMIVKLQMPLKQKLGVGAMFALGIFVVIASIIRAYYSSKNETMLTCTVSMVETSVAIIATCLPALRTVLIGQASRAGTASGPHYELGSSKRTRVRASVAATLRHDNYLNTGHNNNKTINDSEDDLVRDIEKNPRASYLSDEAPPMPTSPISPMMLTREFMIDAETGNMTIVKF